MNIQCAICDHKVYILEANPRASRTVPLVSKVCNVAMARIATQLMLGTKSRDLKLRQKTIPHIDVKAVVLPFNMFPEVGPVLGPEMRSIGEVPGMAPTFCLAYFKAQEAAQSPLPREGTVFVSEADNDEPSILETSRKFQELGFRIKATSGTCVYLRKNGVKAEVCYKVHELQRPNIVDEIKSNEIQLIINTPIRKMGAHDDAYIRARRQSNTEFPKSPRLRPHVPPSWESQNTGRAARGKIALGVSSGHTVNDGVPWPLCGFVPESW